MVPTRTKYSFPFFLPFLSLSYITYTHECLPSSSPRWFLQEPSTPFLFSFPFSLFPTSHTHTNVYQAFGLDSFYKNQVLLSLFSSLLSLSYITHIHTRSFLAFHLDGSARTKYSFPFFPLC